MTINPLARARGHGSARQGVHHWYLQRATALLLIPLTGWLLYAIISLSGRNYADAIAFLGHPLNSTAAILLAIAGFYHAIVGLQVVIEDYVHTPAIELSLQFLVRALAYAGMVASVLQILKIALA